MMKLTNVHEALNQAATSPSPDNHEAMITATFRIEKETKRKVREICSRHGTDLSSFMRQCCIALIADYGEVPDQPIVQE